MVVDNTPPLPYLSVSLSLSLSLAVFGLEGSLFLILFTCILKDGGEPYV